MDKSPLNADLSEILSVPNRRAFFDEDSQEDLSILEGLESKRLLAKGIDVSQLSSKQPQFLHKYLAKIYDQVYIMQIDSTNHLSKPENSLMMNQSHLHDKSTDCIMSVNA